MAARMARLIPRRKVTVVFPHVSRALTRALLRRTATVATCVSVGMLAAIQAHAQASALTLDSVYTLVAARSPRIRSASALARAADARVPGSSRPADPQLQFGFMNYGLPALGRDPALGMTQLQVMQDVPFPGKLSAATATARAQAEAAGERIAVATWGARLDAAMAFFDLYQAQAAAALAAGTRSMLNEAAAVAASLYRVGEGRQGDVLRARVEVARLDEEVVRMVAMRDVAAARLAAVADTSARAVDGVPVLPAFPDSVPSVDSLVQLALASRPVLAAATADAGAASAAVTQARRERWPDVQLGLQYGQRRSAMGLDRMASLMLGASVPLFSRDRRSRAEEEATAMHDMARSELGVMRAETRREVAEAHVAVTSARRLRTLYLGTIIPQAEAAATASLSAYRVGSVDFMTVLDNRLAVNRYRQELLALDASEGRAWAGLEMLTGQPIISRAVPGAARTPRGSR